MGDCVFCRIVAGGAPCSRVHEDDVSLGFMGIRPTRPGELMVIPKEHIDHFWTSRTTWRPISCWSLSGCRVRSAGR